MNAVDQRWFEQRGFGEVLSAGLTACAASSGSAFIAAAVCLIPLALAQLVTAYLLGDLGVTEMQKQIQAGELSPEQIDIRAMLLAQLYQLTTGVVAVVSAFFAATALARVIAERVVGKGGGAMSAWDFLMGGLFRILGASVVQGIVAAVGLVVCMLPGIAALVGVMAVTGGMQPGQQPTAVAYVAMGIVGGIPFTIVLTYITLMPMVTGAEQRGVSGTLRRAVGLISGSFVRAWGIVLVASAASGGTIGLAGWVSQKHLMGSMQSSLGDAWGMAVAAVPQIALMLLLAPFAYGIYTALYFDLRSRRTDERFGPQELAYDLDYEIPGAVPEAPTADQDTDGPAAPPPSAPPGSDSRL